MNDIRKHCCDDALTVIDHSISTNRRDDGLYHAYNVLDVDGDELKTEPLYPMLEGQVAALSAGYVTSGEAVEVLEALFDSAVYRADQKSFMLYPDRTLPGFLEKNRVDAGKAMVIPLLRAMLDADDTRIILRDADGNLRFSAEFTNVGDLHRCLDELTADYGESVDEWREPIAELFESVFHHRAFTGRSGTMFGYEGLGSVYWHMVAKLMLAVMENFFAAVDNGSEPETRQRLGNFVLPHTRRHRFQQDAWRIRRISDGPLFAHAEALGGTSAWHDRAGQGRDHLPFRRAGRAGDQR